MIVFQAIVSQRPEMVRRILELTPEIQGTAKPDFRREIDQVDEAIRSNQGDAADLEQIKRMLVARSAATQ